MYLRGCSEQRYIGDNGEWLGNNYGDAVKQIKFLYP